MEEELKKERPGCTCDLCRSEPPKPKARPWWETEYDAVRKRQDKDEQEDMDAERAWLRQGDPDAF